ncbi:hypothetical protein [Streptomyces sp. NPDC057877]
MSESGEWWPVHRRAGERRLGAIRLPALETVAPVRAGTERSGR